MWVWVKVVRVVREGVGVVFGSGDGVFGDVGEVGGGSAVVGWFELTGIVKNREVARCRLLLVGRERGVALKRCSCLGIQHWIGCRGI